MKYTTFTRLRAVIIAALVVTPIAWIGCRKAETPPPATPIAEAPSAPQGDPVPSQPEGDKSSAPAGNVDTAAFTEVHKAIVRLQKEPLSNGKDDGSTVKWVYKDDGIKAEFRCDKDKGFNYWNRVKIDYNGNKKDEERWDIGKDGKIKRRVSPNDDGNFTETYYLQGEKWEKK